jgi:PilZ domain
MEMWKPEVHTSAADTKREKDRESMFLLAVLTFEGSTTKISTRVRNISPGGMMVDATKSYVTGHPVVAELKGIGAVMGRVAWSNQTRTGIAFDAEVDPKLTRLPVGMAPLAPKYTQIDLESKRPGLGIR